MNVYEEILKWSMDRPLWQRDALRRLIAHGELTDSHRSDYLNSCKHDHSLLGKDVAEPKLIPLSREHLPALSDQDCHVTLDAISETQNVNALTLSSSLEFESTGLTAIYGDNGTGKSGYVRILKKSCRCRDSSQEILPNVYKTTGQARATARIAYTIGEHSKQIDFEDGGDGSPHLAAISIFETPSAHIRNRLKARQ